MTKSKDETNLLAKIGVLAAAVVLLPALLAFSYIRDDTAAQVKTRSDRTAAQEAQYRQIMYDELDRRLGNPER